MTIIMQPIYPQLGERKITGFLTFGMGWDYLLESSVGTGDTRRVRCVMTTGKTIYNEEYVYTYEVSNHGAKLLGTTDLHSSTYDEWKVSVEVKLQDTKAARPHRYILTIYPTEEYYSHFHTLTPMLVGIGMVLMILITSIVFFFYDVAVRQDSMAKEQIMAAKRQFVRFVSHEIRTPLSTVSLCMKLLCSQIQENYEDSFMRQDLLSTTDDVIVSTDAAILILNDLLNYDKIENGNFKLDMCSIPIWKFLESTLTPFHISAQQASVKYTLDLNLGQEQGQGLDVEKGRTLCTIGDPLRLTQVLRNIVSNALKFTPPGCSVHVSAAWHSHTSSLSTSDSAAPDNVTDLILISVKDTGAGISKENQQQLFQEGMQFNANELQAGQGSGLGLCISKNIVEMHGGKLWAESEGENCGSTFFVELPVSLQSVPEEESQSEPILSTKPLADTTNKHSSKVHADDIKPHELFHTNDSPKILVVDDVALNRRVLCRILTKRGYLCEQAIDGLECLEKLKEKESKTYFSAILLDYQMPRMTGPEAVEQLRKDGYNLLVVGVTGNVMPEDVELFENSGANLVIQKPFDIDSFQSLCPLESEQSIVGNSVDAEQMI